MQIYALDRPLNKDDRWVLNRLINNGSITYPSITSALYRNSLQHLIGVGLVRLIERKWYSNFGLAMLWGGIGSAY